MRNEYRQGEHICAVYDDEQEQLAIAAEYVADGLRAGERCFYVADDEPALQRFNAVLDARGVDVAAALQRGALAEATKAAAHLADGYFDSERMLRMLNDAVESALNDGFTGLRTCGDMSWLLDHAPGSTQVVEYEALLNQFFEGVRALGMCQYDRHRLPPGLIDHALATHSSAVVGGQHKSNPFYRPPSIAMSRAAQPTDLGWKLSELKRR